MKECAIYYFFGGGNLRSKKLDSFLLPEIFKQPNQNDQYTFIYTYSISSVLPVYCMSFERTEHVRGMCSVAEPEPVFCLKPEPTGLI